LQIDEKQDLSRRLTQINADKTKAPKAFAYPRLSAFIGG
jgi:hypothetical protein